MRKSVSPSVMSKISELYPSLNPQWLLAGFGEMLLKEDKEDEKGVLLPSEMLEELLVEARTEKARLLANNEKLTAIIESQQETLAELTRQLKKANVRAEGDVGCAAAV